jgi:NACalpha-BTF3-like transcription factor
MVDVGLHQLLHDFMDNLQDYYKVEVEKEHMRHMQERKEKDPEREMLNERMEADRKDRAAECPFARGIASRKRPNRRAKRTAKVAEILEAIRRDCEDFYKKEAEKEHMRQMQEREEKNLERELPKEQMEADRKDKAAEYPAMPAACRVVGDDSPNDELFTSLFQTMQDDSFHKVLADTLCGADGDAGESAGVAPIFPALVGREDNDVEAIPNRNAKKRAQKKRAQAARGSQAAPAKKIEASVAAETEDEGDVDESGTVPNDIELVMSQALCSRRLAVAALRANNNDIVEAIMHLTAPTKQLVLGVGSRVRLEGLNAAAFNGRTGIATAFDEANERWAVTFDGGTGHETKLFKAVNVVVIANVSVAAEAEDEGDSDDSGIVEAEDEGDVDGSGIVPSDIALVMSTVPCSRGKAIAALRANNNDIVEAFKWLVP